MFFIIRYVITWGAWLVFADKSRWRELLPTALFACLLGSTTDHLMGLYKLWSYQDSGFPTHLIKIMDDWGIYLVVTYLFLQWLPKCQSFLNMARYILIWSLGTIAIEWIHTYTGHMAHYKFWTLGLSFICDGLLFLLFYYTYRVFHPNTSTFSPTTSYESLGDIVLFLTLQGKVVDCYSTWLKENHFDPKMEVGKVVEEIDGLTDVSLHYKAFEKISKGERVTFQFKWLASNQRTYCFQNTLSPVANGQGNIVGMIGILNEVDLPNESKMTKVL